MNELAIFFILLMVAYSIGQVVQMIISFVCACLIALARSMEIKIFIIGTNIWERKKEWYNTQNKIKDRCIIDKVYYVNHSNNVVKRLAKVVLYTKENV